MDITNGIPDTGDIPPINAPPGHIWYNTAKGDFYYMSEHGNWIATDSDDNVIDIIMGAEQDTPEKAYERAMSIL